MKMKGGGIIEFFGNPAMWLVTGIIVAIIVAFVLFTFNPDTVINFFKGFAPK